MCDRWFQGKFAFGLTLALCLSLIPSARAGEAGDPDEEFLREAKIATDDASLQNFLRQRSGNDDDLLHLDRLIPQLGSSDFQQREEASRKLVGIGFPAVVGLTQTLKGSDREIVRRARVCLEEIHDQAPSAASLAAVRVLLRRQTPGTFEVLLRYLPYATADEEVEEEIWYGLDELAKRDAKVREALAVALADALPDRRAVASCILGHRGNQEQREAARKRLTDAAPVVRLRAAQGLLAAKDKAGIPVLVALLDDPAVILSWQAEELLHWAAGDEAPEETVGTGKGGMAACCRQAWEEWWRQHGAALDLGRLDEDPGRPGLVLACCCSEAEEEKGHVWVFGCDGKPRWEFKGGGFDFVDVHLLPTGSLLVAEQGGGTRWVQGPPPHREPNPSPGVTERALDGTILWQDKETQLTSCFRRVANGSIFIAHVGLREFTAVGEEIQHVRKYDFNQSPAVPAEFLWNGRVVFAGIVHDEDLLLEADARNGRELKRTRLEQNLRSAKLRSLRGGGYLAANYFPSKVVETDASGKTVWQHTPGACDAVRLRNGNTLLSSGHWGFKWRRGQVHEITPDGKTVWEAFTTWPPNRLQVALGLVRLGFDAARPSQLDLATDREYRMRGLKRKDAFIRANSAEELAPNGIRAVFFLRCYSTVRAARGDAASGITPAGDSPTKGCDDPPH
jgi:HEAT repeat protein